MVGAEINFDGNIVPRIISHDDEHPGSLVRIGLLRGALTKTPQLIMGCVLAWALHQYAK